jgi:hypothetical protein
MLVHSGANLAAGFVLYARLVEYTQ